MSVPILWNRPVKRKLTKWDSLRTLRDGGMEIGTVIDVGVQRSSEDLQDLFPGHRHILFEPVAEYAEAIRENYAGMDFDLVTVALTDRNGPMHLDDVGHDDQGVVSHVHLSDQASGASRMVEGRTLDTHLHRIWKAGRIARTPYLIKIDVDGHELEVMRGARDALKLAACVVVETTLPGLVERCVLAEKAGLRLWDLVDISYYRGSMYQADLVFLSATVLDRHPSFDPVRLFGSEGMRADWWYSHQ